MEKQIWRARYIRSIFIESRAYFDKTGGNTYFSARISVDGKLIGALPFQYGYGNHFETMALEWLKANDVVDPEHRNLQELENYGVNLYSVQYWTTKTETKRFVDIAEESFAKFPAWAF